MNDADSALKKQKKEEKEKYNAFRSTTFYSLFFSGIVFGLETIVICFADIFFEVDSYEIVGFVFVNIFNGLWMAIAFSVVVCGSFGIKQCRLYRAFFVSYFFQSICVLLYYIFEVNSVETVPQVLIGISILIQMVFYSVDIAYKDINKICFCFLFCLIVFTRIASIGSFFVLNQNFLKK